ncbi:NUDIX hydrolase [Candidatus Margulisiibacteriota bacterium]
MDLREKLIKSEPAYKGKVIDLKLDTVELPSGKASLRECVIHEPTVAVLPIKDNGKIILIKQYRHCTEKELLEIPAGSIDKGESVEDTVQRELAEEIGYEADKLEKICEAFTTPGFTNEYMYFYVAKELKEKKKKGDEDEFIEVLEYTIAEVQKMIEKKEIIDAKTILAINYYLLNKDK